VIKKEMGRACGTDGEQERTGFWWVEPMKGRTLVTAICRWEGNIKMDFQDMRWTGMEWIDLAQNSVKWRVLANALRILRVPKNAGNFLTS
jgi:hypothetical protein